MAFVHSTNALFLSLLLLCASITVYADKASSPAYPPKGHHHHHHHAPAPAPSHPPIKPPSHPPVKPPAHPPVKPPAKPPTSSPPVKPPTPSVKPPTYPPVRKLVAIRGMVFCKSCKYRGVETLTNAVPLAGAVLKLQCNNTKIPLVEQTKADAKGFFFFLPQKLTTAAWHKCKVFLVSSPLARCSVPTNLHAGAAGAALIPTPLPPPANQTSASKFMLFTVGPFAFEPHKRLPCHY
ncbi:hypothetical protein ACJIZ3_013212 [Penstemon smallii]|uniref:Uncharacterized protein n=1 Tax=Penstemon smallii TaxID=265156 RepID=A0ABD3UPL2_9LAMI